MVRAGLQAIYLSGWQVAADSNSAGAMYPDQSLYPANSGPELARKINKTLQRADQIEHMEGGAERDWFAPIVADAEAGFGGPLNCFEIMKAYIEAGAAAVHFEDQLASEKKCGHLGGKVLIPTQAAIRNLDAARLAADVCGVPTIIVARTDAESAKLITSDVDERDRPFITGERTPEGFFRLKDGTGLDHCIARGLAFAPHADLLWFETSHPDLEDARTFADAIHAQFPGKLLAYNCSPSFNWAAKLDADTIARFQARARRDGLQVPVRHFGRLPQPQPRDVRAGERLPRPRHGGLFGAAAGRVRERGRGLHRDPPPARSRHGLFRRGRERDLGRPGVDRCAQRIDRDRAVSRHRSHRGGVRRKIMGQRYWVVGGHYSDCRFKDIEPGTEIVHGPYNDEVKARMEWQRLTFRDRCAATERYSICVEPVLQ